MLQTSLSLGPVVHDGCAPLSLATLPSPFLCRLRYTFLTARLTGEVSCITQVLTLCTSQSRCQRFNHSAVRFSTFVTDVQLKQKNCKTLFMPDIDWVNKDVMTWKWENSYITCWQESGKDALWCHYRCCCILNITSVSDASCNLLFQCLCTVNSLSCHLKELAKTFLFLILCELMNFLQSYPHLRIIYSFCITTLACCSTFCPTWRQYNELGTVLECL